VDINKAGVFRGGCGFIVYRALHVIGSVLGILLIGILIVLGLISDLLFGELR